MGVPRRTRMSAALTVSALAATSALLAGCGTSGPPMNAFCDALETHQSEYIEFVTKVEASKTGGEYDSQYTASDFEALFRGVVNDAPDELKGTYADMADAASRSSDGGIEDAAAGSMSDVWAEADSYVQSTCQGYEPITAEIYTPEPVEETPVATEPSPSFGLTTGGGYNYTIVIDSFNASAASSVTNAPPGKTDLTIQYSFAATLTNTTPGRTLNELYLPVIALAFPASSTICTTPLEQQAYGGGTTDARTLTISGGGCTLVLNTVSTPSSFPGVDQSVTLHSSTSPWTTDGGSATTSTMFYRVDEAVAPTLASEVQGASLVVGYTSQMVGQRGLSFTPEACSAQISNATGPGSFDARIGLQGDVQVCQ